MKKTALLLSLLAMFAGGCASYRWTSRVPEEIRTVAVPVFMNRTTAAELGPIATEYVLREFQREGTFKIRRSGDSTIEVQGEITKATRHHAAYDRSFGRRASEYRYVVTAEISLINRDTGRTLLEKRAYTAETTFQVQGDLLTGQRNAAARIAQDLARQIVDDVVSYPYNRPAESPASGK